MKVIFDHLLMNAIFEHLLSRLSLPVVIPVFLFFLQKNKKNPCISKKVCIFAIRKQGS